MKKTENTSKDCKFCQKSFKTNINGETGSRLGRYRVYCNRKCKSKYEKASNYRSIKRNGMKLEFIKSKGGKCEICGYSKNYAALCFHHIDPKKKEFGLSVSRFSTKNKSRIIKEIEKCQLLCCNCHAEVHNKESLI